MYQLYNLHEAENIKNDVPPEVIEFAKNALHIIDTEYGKSRELYQDGGEVIIIAPDDNLDVLKEAGINIENIIAEFSNIFPTLNGIDYLHVFTLRNNDYSVQILLPKHLAPINMIDC
jgi:hypothetical protein